MYVCACIYMTYSIRLCMPCAWVTLAINKGHKQRKREGFVCAFLISLSLPLSFLLSTKTKQFIISPFLSFSVSLHLTFITHNQKKHIEGGVVVVKLSIYQSINQSRDQSSSYSSLSREEKRERGQDVIILFYITAGPPPTFRAALLCPLQHL